MQLSATETSKVHATELANDMLENLLSLATIQIRGSKSSAHLLNLVKAQVFRISTMELADVAVSWMNRFVLHVLLHLVPCIVRVSAVRVGALVLLERLQSNHHLDRQHVRAVKRCQVG